VNGTIKQNVYITLSVTTTAIMLINLQGVRLIFDSSCQVGIYCCFRVCFLIYLVRILIKQEKRCVEQSYIILSIESTSLHY